MDAVLAAVTLVNRRKKFRNKARGNCNGIENGTDTPDAMTSDDHSIIPTPGNSSQGHLPQWVINSHTAHEENGKESKHDNSNDALKTSEEAKFGDKQADLTDRRRFPFRFFNWLTGSRTIDKTKDSTNCSNEERKLLARKRSTEYFDDAYDEFFIFGDAEMPVTAYIALSLLDKGLKSCDVKPDDSSDMSAGKEFPFASDKLKSKILELNGTGPKDTKLNGTGPEDTKLNGTGPEGTKLNGTGPKDTKLNGTGPKDTKLNGTGPEGTKLNGTGPKGTKLNGTGPKGTKLNGTGPEDTKLNGSGPKNAKPKGDEQRKSKSGESKSTPQKSKNPKDAKSKDAKSEVSRRRIFSLNDVCTGKTTEKKEPETRSPRRFWLRNTKGNKDEKLISDETWAKWSCEWKYFKHLFMIGNSRMITKNFHNDLGLDDCKFEDDDDDTEDLDTEVDTMAQDTEVDTAAQDTEVTKTEIQDTQPFDLDIPDFFNNMYFRETAKSKGYHLFDKPLLEVYEDFVRMQEKQKERLETEDLSPQEPIGSFDNPGHGPMEVSCKLKQSKWDLFGMKKYMDRQKAQAHDTDIDAESFLRNFSAQSNTWVGRNSITSFIRSQQWGESSYFEAIEYDDRGMELRVTQGPWDQVAGAFRITIHVIDVTGACEDCVMVYRTVPPSAVNPRGQECIKCEVSSCQGKQEVHKAEGLAGLALYDQFKANNAWATNVGWSYSEGQLF